MKTKILFALTALASLLNTACSVETMNSDQVVPQAIYQSYSVTYHAASDSTEYYAQFRAGGPTGTTLSLTDPSMIKANNSKLSSKWMLGTYYSRSVSGFHPEATFEWTDNQQKVYQNSAVLKPISIRQAAATISAKSPYEVELDVQNLSSDEEVSVSLSQERQGQEQKDYRLVRAAYDPNNRKAIFSPAELAKLWNGNATLTVTRGKSQALKQSPNSKGNLSATYVAPPRTVVIMDVAPLSLAGR